MSPPAVDLRTAFAGRSVFVTGHTGFKGSWLSLWLAELGARVYGYALPPPTEPNAFVAAGVREVLASHVEGDIRDGERLLATLRACTPDVVLHLAAQPIVRLSYVEPRETFDVNVMGTVSVLEAVRRLGRPCAVIAVTSDKCYENAEHEWGYRELDPMGGADPYSASKGATELVVGAYRRSFFPPSQANAHGILVASARAGNVIGGGDWAPDRILADLARQLSRGEPAALRNRGAIRPWQHVLEPLSGYLLLAARLLGPTPARFAQAWNFGPSALEVVTVGELADLFIAAWGSGRWLDQQDPAAPPEARTLRLCIDRAVAELGWRPRWSVAEAVSRTARWYRAYYDARGRDDATARLRALTLADIAEYPGQNAA